MKFNILLNIIYYGFIGFVGLTTALLVFSIFPVPGNYKVMVVQSGSMEPAIKTGAIVVIRPVSDYKIDDVITFGPYSKTKSPTTHRIQDIKVSGGQMSYITKGDANNAPDRREVRKGDVLGKVLFSVPFLGYVVETARKPFGFAALVAVPVGIIIYDEAMKIKEELKKSKAEKITLEHEKGKKE